jgi:two-component system response regulator AtoC
MVSAVHMCCRISVAESMHTVAPTQEASLPLTRLDFRFIKSGSAATEGLFRALENLAQTDAPVLIVGEGGTGKRALAAEIHRMSGRLEEDFRAVNCADLNSNDALAFENLAPTQTVYLREIAEMSALQQSKAMELFLNGNGDAHGPVSVRVIASSQRNPHDDVRNGKFREDLYYRISNFCLCVPPLRQRKEDIPLLAQHFADRYSNLLGRPVEISPQVLQVFSSYSWPGNIRELEYIVRTIVAIGDENIALALIRASGLKNIGRDSKLELLSLKQAAREASRRAERELILSTLSRTHWNRKRAARELQISYKALLYKLKQIGVDDDTSLGAER